MKYLLDKKNFQLIDGINNEKLLFYTINTQLFSINDDEIINYLNYCKSRKNTKQISKSNLKEYYTLLTKAFDESYQPTQDNNEYLSIIDNVILPISGNCNLKCSYCFASNNENAFNFNNYTEEEAKQVIDFLLINKKLKKLHISFFGGEPLLKTDIIEYVINYVKNNFKKNEIKFSITTNGTILNKKILKILKENNIPLLISIDGPKELNNHRKFQNNKNSFDRVIENIHILNENGIDIYLRATMASDNLKILDTHIFFGNLGFPFSIIYAHDTISKNDYYSKFSDKLLEIKNQYKKLISYYTKRVKNNETINCLSITDKLTKIFYRNKNYYACTGGRSLLSITSDGNIYSCEHLTGIKQYSIGNIKYGIDNKKIKSLQAINVENIEECSKCWLRYLCSGGCFANNISSTGNSRKPDKNKCSLIQLEYEFIMILYNEIKKIQPDFFTITK